MAEKWFFFIWKDFGWETIPDAGDQYFYMFGKYTDQKEPHPFAKRIIDMVDLNGDGEVSNYELQQAVKDKEKLEITSKLIVKHPSEWAMGDTIAKFKEELIQVHAKGIRKETNAEREQELIKQRDAKIEQTLFRVQQLNFWSKLTNGEVTTKAQRKAAFFASKGVTPLNGTMPTGSGAANKAKRDQQLTEEFNALEAKRSPRQFPSDSKVWHFHPIAFVEQMKMICGAFYQKGDKGKDKGKIIQEINIRLAGFGGKAFNILDAKRIPRQFPSTSKVWHFHPIAFIDNVKLIIQKNKDSIE